MRTAIGTTMKASTSIATVVTKRNRSTRRGGATAPERREPQGGEDRGETWAEEMGRRYEERAMGVRAMRRGGGREERTQGFRLPRFPRVARLDAGRMRKGDATKPHSTPHPGKLLL